MEYRLVWLVLAVLRWLPAGCSYAFTHAFAEALYRVDARRRRVTLDNLRVAFPDQSARARRRLARRSYHSAAETAAECALVLNGRLDNTAIDAMIDATALPRLQALERETKTGIVVITAHFGNWELLFDFLGRHLERTCHAVGRKTTNGLIEKHIVAPLRERSGNHLIYKKNALFRTVRALRDGEHVGLLIDQKSNRKHGVKCTFLDRPAMAVATPAGLQIRLGAPVVPVFLVRTARARYRLDVGHPLEGETPVEPDDRIRQLTQQHQEAIETMVRQYPEQWFWMHDRWRMAH